MFLYFLGQDLVRSLAQNQDLVGLGQDQDHVDTKMIVMALVEEIKTEKEIEKKIRMIKKTERMKTSHQSLKVKMEN